MIDIMCEISNINGVVNGINGVFNGVCGFCCKGFVVVVIFVVVFVIDS